MFRLVRVLYFLALSAAGFAATGTGAQAGYAHFIYDVTSGKILASESADTLNHPASLTKMMTLYMTFEAIRAGRLSWEQQIVMTPNAASKIPSKLGVKAGLPITVREAVYGMAIRSANDAAATMGDYLGGTEEHFAELMTAKARSLGMNSTVFRNASGLPDDAQVTTARDMAVLALALIRDFPNEYQIFSMRNFEFRGRRVRGHNNLMYRYPGMDGVKTGFVNASGYNIASAVVVNGKRYIGVVMGGKSARKRDDQMAALLDQYTQPNGGAGANALVASANKVVPVPTPSAVVETEKRAGEGPKTLSYAAPRKEITIATASGGATPRGAIANLYAMPQPKPAAPSAWSVQIAAAGSAKQASDMLEKALPMLSADFGKVAPSVEGYKNGGREYFRARFVGFASEEAANSACATLQQKSLACNVVR
ncbi:D-alanyl-D-alanine carboxypeptidase (penicillin-binding protein 5/6) [Neorhizobium alkalisoli]|uniref:D-alanyl-D-alanine carboxypeptidase (Penicillin-binding protein 5/6) n=2 Tax=Neorhizobium alkalisoli TaxID=528178 RepID=A0A561QWB7_9HYPH|nr:D-alanyl-D-alanine carboxypeptidase (penicillin-binding protein 5/6) [Neorhizobium alkalisoli]